MRWLKGGSLRECVEDGPLEFPELTRLLDQIGEALAFAHEHDVIHRDLKLENVLLDEADNAYLTDFGIAKDLRGPGMTEAGRIIGTVDCLSLAVAADHWSRFFNSFSRKFNRRGCGRDIEGNTQSSQLVLVAVDFAAVHSPNTCNRISLCIFLRSVYRHGPTPSRALALGSPHPVTQQAIGPHPLARKASIGARWNTNGHSRNIGALRW
jgi:serine/threonine protein kinase